MPHQEGYMDQLEADMPHQEAFMHLQESFVNHFAHFETSDH